VRLADLVEELDAYFRVPEVRDDDWSGTYQFLYPDPYWREFAEPDYEGRWNGLMVRGDADVERVRTCVFPSDSIIAAVESRSPSSPSIRSRSRTRFEASSRWPVRASSA
jgi:hypothetical protein